MKPLSIFKNGSHIFISGPVKCKMFCQRNANQKKKKKKPAIHFGDNKKKKIQLFFKFYYKIHCKFFVKWHFPQNLV